MKSIHLVVLGAGPGGYTAAFQAADKGMNVTLVDSHPRQGGVCLHRGCIPSKTLLHLARLITETREAKKRGLNFSEPEIDLVAMRRWKDQVIGKMASGLDSLCKQRGVKVVRGHGVFVDSHTLKVDGKQALTFDHAILAVGSVPAIPPSLDLKSPRIMDSTSALEFEEIPARLLIIGGGYIGLEMGTFYAALGSNVTVVEMLDGLLPGVDRDLVRPLQARLKKEFEQIILNAKVESLEEKASEIKVNFDGDVNHKEQQFDRILISVGRIPNSRGLGLENTRVKVDGNGFVVVDQQQKTDDPSIMAIGDVVGGAMLAHKASYEAKIAVEVLAGEAVQFDSKAVPAVVFTDPEIAWCGLTEEAARASGKTVNVARFPWLASGRATTLDRNDGLTKLILEPQTERILGVGVVGSGAGELIAEGVLAVEMGATARDLAKAIHPHPTLSETLMEAAEVALGKAVHIYKRPRPGNAR